MQGMWSSHFLLCMKEEGAICRDEDEGDFQKEAET